MKNSNNEYHDRLRKLNEIKEKGINPYPAKFERTYTTEDCIKFGEENDLRDIKSILKKPTKKLLKISGRLTAFRSHGKISFGNLQDFSGKLQVCFMQDKLGKDDYKFLKKVDIADFLGLEGELFETKHGELTLLVYKYTMLSKALMPLPEKWHGIKGQEHKYRQRYLDLIMNRDTMDRFIFRSNFLKVLREFYWKEEFIEIETPYLENVSGGAVAKPFITHHNALDIDMYLRIAGGELWQKTAIVGGFEKTFEIARCFRNEGMDPSHLQEFTMVEHYCAFWDAETNMQFTERMFEHLLMKLFGKTKVTVKDRDGNDTEVDFKTPWPRKEYTKMIEEDCGIDVLKFYGDEVALLKEIKKKGIKIEDPENLGYGNLVDSLYKKVSRPKLIQPCFVILHPTDTKPLARKNDENPRLADTFQVLVNTWEVVNAYGEIVDPIDQRERFEAQALAKAKGDEEAMMVNEEYLTTMSHGMPCMSGWGMGIDRMVTLLTGQENLKDLVLFPIMKPLEEHSKKNKKAQEKARKLAKKKKSNG
ncbi:lysine--tRNA ligase [Candidatus Peregrinibacteria bacterium]|nr:lysine--tRNA ligase [Candidatus Peregrinibacteria bacterium]